MNTVIITGGTKGVGAEIARGFLKANYKVVIGARNRSGLANEKHSNLKFFKIDVRNESDHLSLIKKTLKWSKTFICYINCAGFSSWNPINNVNEDFLNKMFDINLKGTVWGCKAAANFLPVGGSIINISSLAGKRGSKNNSIYCATKFGVNGITQSLSKELGEKSIRVNAVCPVYIKTKGLLEALENSHSPTLGKETKTYLNEFAKDQAALNRLPNSSEIADFCVYLASTSASAITGQCINVDCGVFPQ